MTDRVSSFKCPYIKELPTCDHVFLWSFLPEAGLVLTDKTYSILIVVQECNISLLLYFTDPTYYYIPALCLHLQLPRDLIRNHLEYP